MSIGVSYSELPLLWDRDLTEQDLPQNNAVQYFINDSLLLSLMLAGKGINYYVHYHRAFTSLLPSNDNFRLSISSRASRSELILDLSCRQHLLPFYYLFYSRNRDIKSRPNKFKYMFLGMRYFCKEQQPQRQNDTSLFIL